MNLSFTKMHGLGNDFVVFDAINQKVKLSTGQIKVIADRHLGIGCDQVLIVEAPHSIKTDFYYRIFNADGAEVKQCGNGARCFASFVWSTGLSDKEILHVGTISGDIHLRQEDDGQVRVNMGMPVLEPDRIPFAAAAQSNLYNIEVGDESLKIAAISMGNPHAVLQVASLADAQVEQLGPQLGNHPRFPERTNVGFMLVRDRQHIDLRVYERGVGETLACGTGACAAVVAGQLNNLLDNQVKVSLPGGNLVISWGGIETPVWMSGPTTHVFEGKITL
ncbi:Diaminopimelate epimerase [hydrothermal vent metagenome]|uniref:Diaminopimelate epimerase n=1 Tax=hydrothermal vent metagenome TaxID=652676 RepID=A0A3B1B051_9ZZZZ